MIFISSVYGTTKTDTEEFLGDVFKEGVIVDLREPVYSDGLLKTDKGGVVTAPNIRVQGRKLVYIRKMVDNKPVFRIEAEGELMVEYCDRAFIGERLEYDFQTGEGFVIAGRGAMPPWYFGGDFIELCSNGSYIIRNAYLTTSANRDTDWQIRAAKVKVNKHSLLDARNVQFRFVKLPVFWLPSFHTNLKTLWKPPIRYHARWSGELGPRAGLSYLIMGGEEWNLYLLLDYSFTRGLGGGIETHYQEECGPRSLNTKSYIANDSSVQDPSQRERYRLAGNYHDTLDNDRVIVDLAYDKLSDKYMATDYYQKGFDTNVIGRSHLTVHRRECSWMATLHAHARLNEFQTIKQELPTISASLHPWTIGASGIISETRARASYLVFRYDENLTGVRNFDAPRLEVEQTLLRSVHLGPLSLTPSIGVVGIYYGDSPKDSTSNQVVGILTCRTHTDLCRFYGCCKHNIQPYLHYTYYSTSSRPTVDHYLFDIDDGWCHLNMLRLGLANTLYAKKCEGCVQRRLLVDTFANAFFSTDTMDKTVPKIYSQIDWKVTDCFNAIATTAWDFSQHEVDHYNLRTAWTRDEDLAIAVEYRHREDYSWRKLDSDNYVLENFHPEADLRASSLSDRRDILLAHIFYRFCPTWAIEVRSRIGWHRRTESELLEYQADLHGALRGSWKVRLSYQHKENDNRFAINIALGAQPPKERECPTVKMARGNY